MRSQRGVVNRWLSWQLSQCQRPDAHLSLAEKDNIQLFSANSNNGVTLVLGDCETGFKCTVIQTYFLIGKHQKPANKDGPVQM